MKRIITIFGLAGTGTSTCGKILAEKLGYEFISTGNMVRKIADEYGMDLHDFEKRLKENPEIDKKLDQKITKIGKEKDNLVIDSRLAWYFIPHSFKVKFLCDNDVRIQRVADRDGIPFEEAENQTLHRESLHVEKYRDLYGIDDYENDINFDLVIESTNLDQNNLVNKIIQFIDK